MEQLFLSFIVPVYNAEGYIAETLNSLLHQDISDYEILCVNDGSTDGSAEILQYYAQSYPNLRILHQENGGVVSARNAGLSAARGEFIWFVDADDLVMENCLGTLRAHAREGGFQRIVFSGYSFTDVLTPEEEAQALSGSLPCNVPWQDSVVWRSLLRRDFLLENQLCFRYPGLTHGEDGVFMYEVLLCSPQTKSLSQPLYFYRIHSGSAETLVTPAQHRKKLRSYLRLVEIYHGYYQSGQKNSTTANKLMTFLWFSLYELAHLPRQEAAEGLGRLNALGLYPGKILPECDLERTYLFDSQSRFGQLLETIGRNLTAPWGYQALRCLLGLKSRLRR